jgi:ABC-type transporter Mla subunit MlaD
MDIERTMAFIVEHQAKFAVSIEKLEHGLEDMRAGFGELRENQIQAQRQQLFWQENFGRALLGLTENLDALTQRADREGDRMDRLAAAQQLADERFAEFVRNTNDRFAKVEAQVDNLNRPN